MDNAEIEIKELNMQIYALKQAINRIIYYLRKYDKTQTETGIPGVIKSELPLPFANGAPNTVRLNSVVEGLTPQSFGVTGILPKTYGAP